MRGMIVAVAVVMFGCSAPFEGPGEDAGATPADAHTALPLPGQDAESAPDAGLVPTKDATPPPDAPTLPQDAGEDVQAPTVDAGRADASSGNVDAGPGYIDLVCDHVDVLTTGERLASAYFVGPAGFPADVTNVREHWTGRWKCAATTTSFTTGPDNLSLRSGAAGTCKAGQDCALFCLDWCEGARVRVTF